MTEQLTVQGIIANEPRFLVTQHGIAMLSFRLAVPSRVFDKTANVWSNGPTNWYTATAFRNLATNAHKSLHKGDRVLAHGTLRIRTWEQDDRSGTTVEIDLSSVGHDLDYGVSTWTRAPRASTSNGTADSVADGAVTEWSVASIPGQ